MQEDAIAFPSAHVEAVGIGRTPRREEQGAVVVTVRGPGAAFD